MAWPATSTNEGRNGAFPRNAAVLFSYPALDGDEGNLTEICGRDIIAANGKRTILEVRLFFSLLLSTNGSDELKRMMDWKGGFPSPDLPGGPRCMTCFTVNAGKN